ncbi:MAG TPA: glycosyltransferase [Alphaproteobacteria bacterium]|nr:glycosyltransferase [Alphaproteobacteria bacterium]
MTVGVTSRAPAIATVICTYRRPRSLARTLSSLAVAAPPRRAAWRVVLVDNADCAETRAVAAGFRDRLPLEILIEPEAGLSRARNAAVLALDVDYFLWTDDDVVVDAGWLRAYEAAFDAFPDAAYFGGPVELHFEGEPPGWLPGALPLIGTAFARRSVVAGLGPVGDDPRRIPFGANMAIRGREQRAHLYDVRRGRQPGRFLLSGEESAVLTRIRAAGGDGIWVPAAQVTHWIPPDRQSISYLRRYYEGRFFAGARATPPDQLPTARHLWRDLLRSELSYLRGRLTRQPEIWVTALKKASKLRGILAARRELGARGG